MEKYEAVKIAVIGTGLIGPRHAQSVQRHPGCQLLCIVDPREEAKAVADTFQVPLFISIAEMLRDCLPDAAIVCTPNHSHVDVSSELLQAGIHVLVEKPISTDLTSGRKLLEAARDARRHLLVGHHRRFNPSVSATKRTLSDGLIGRPIAVNGLWTTYKPHSYFQPPTEWRSKSGTGGPILINLIHDVDILQYLLGPIVRVHAEKTISQRNHEAEEGAAILFRFKSGVVGTFILSDATPSTHNFENGTGENPLFPKAGNDFYRIFGSEGTLSVGDMKLERYPKGVEKSWTSSLVTEDTLVGAEVPFDEQIENLVQVVRGVMAPVCTGEDGLQALLVCDAVHQAMNSGMAVDIPC